MKTGKHQLEKNETNNDKSTKSKSTKKVIILLIFAICIIILIGIAIYTSKNFMASNKDKGKIEEAQDYMEDENYDDQVENLKKMQEKSKNIISWIKIDDTKINYPVLQTDDNEYYLDHDYENNESQYGSIFLKATCDVNDVNSNLIIYGHNMKDGEMFTGIMQYGNKAFWDEHNLIQLITDNGVREYEVMSAFRSRVFYKRETDVFRFYNYLKFENEEKYNEYVNNVKKIQLYDTGVTAEYGEQLMTLITCEYSQENGRFVVVAKRIS